MPSKTLSAHGYLLYPNPRNQHRIVFEHHVFVPHPYAIIDIPAMGLAGKTSVYAACLSVRSPEGHARQTAEHVCRVVEAWSANKHVITSEDIRRQAAKALAPRHPEAAYLYQHHRVIL